MMQRSTILLVEDSSDDVEFFERALREVGQDFDVHVAPSGGEAIDYLQRACEGGEVRDYPVPKIIIMDNGMPCITGADFLRWISEHPIYRIIPTVVLTGSDQPSEVKRAFELGVQGYFVKPMSKPELAELLKLIFRYWAQSCVPPVKEYEVTARGEPAMPKTER